MRARCNKCGYIGDIKEFPQGHDFFQHRYIKGCPQEGCTNSQTPGGAAMHMITQESPFTIIREKTTEE